MTAILKVRDKTTGKWVSIPAIKGDTGATPDIALTVSMLDEDAVPTVSKTGTAESPLFAVGVPRGRTGLQGDATDAVNAATSAAASATTAAGSANDAASSANSSATSATNAATAATTAASAAITAAGRIVNLEDILAGKMDVTGGNIANGTTFANNLNTKGVRTVVSVVKTSAYTYRKWSDGFMEYFGVHTLSGTNGTLYLPITFSSADYMVITHGITHIRHLKAYRSAGSFTWWQNQVNTGTDVNETNGYSIYCAGY